MEGAAENSGRATTGEDGSGVVVGTMTGVEGVARGTEGLTTGEADKVLAGMEGRTTGDEGMMTGEEGRITVEAGGNVTCLIGLPGFEVTTVTTLAACTASSTVSLNLLSRMESNSASSAIVLEEIAGLLGGSLRVMDPSPAAGSGVDDGVIPSAWGGTVTNRLP